MASPTLLPVPPRPKNQRAPLGDLVRIPRRGRPIDSVRPELVASRTRIESVLSRVDAALATMPTPTPATGDAPFVGAYVGLGQALTAPVRPDVAVSVAELRLVEGFEPLPEADIATELAALAERRLGRRVPSQSVGYDIADPAAAHRIHTLTVEADEVLAPEGPLFLSDGRPFVSGNATNVVVERVADGDCQRTPVYAELQCNVSGGVALWTLPSPPPGRD